MFFLNGGGCCGSRHHPPKTSIPPELLIEEARLKATLTANHIVEPHKNPSVSEKQDPVKDCNTEVTKDCNTEVTVVPDEKPKLQEHKEQPHNVPVLYSPYGCGEECEVTETFEQFHDGAGAGLYSPLGCSEECEVNNPFAIKAGVVPGEQPKPSEDKEPLNDCNRSVTETGKADS